MIRMTIKAIELRLTCDFAVSNIVALGCIAWNL